MVKSGISTSIRFSSTCQQLIPAIIFLVLPVNSKFLPLFFLLDPSTANFGSYFFSRTCQQLIPATIFSLGLSNT